MSEFTEEQLKEIETVFGLTREDTLIIKDARITKGQMVWWHSSDGPQWVNSKDQWDNIEYYPMFYSRQKPKCTVTYEEK